MEPIIGVLICLFIALILMFVAMLVIQKFNNSTFKQIQAWIKWKNRR